MARYRAGDSGERRTAFFGFQVTPEEKAELVRRAKAFGRRPSDYGRLVLLSDLKAPAPPANDPEAIAGLSFQLSKIGTNLNQLARLANERRALPREAELSAVLSEIKAALSKVLA